MEKGGPEATPQHLHTVLKEHIPEVLSRQSKGGRRWRKPSCHMERHVNTWPMLQSDWENTGGAEVSDKEPLRVDCSQRYSLPSPGLSWSLSSLFLELDLNDYKINMHNAYAPIPTCTTPSHISYLYHTQIHTHIQLAHYTYTYTLYPVMYIHYI